MIKIAFSIWNQRIAPVFDVARRIRVVETEAGKVIGDREEALADDSPARKALDLARFGVSVLICGAISRPLHTLIRTAGIRVIAFVAGDTPEVVRAWLEGHLDEDTWSMPGCRGGGRRFCGGSCELYSGEVTMVGNPSRGGGGGGAGGVRGQGAGRPGQGPAQGQGQGQGRGGHGRGRRRNPKTAGSTWTCRCLKCGHQEPHERGVPCADRPCPKCGSAMTRDFQEGF